MCGPFGGGFGGGGIWLGMFFSLIFFLLIIVGIGLLIWWFVSTQMKSEKPTKSSALDILKERYAKGEISKEEYEERKKTLSK